MFLQEPEHLLTLEFSSLLYESSTNFPIWWKKRHSGAQIFRTSDVLPGMPKVLISSKTDLIIGTSGGVEIVEVEGMVESVKIRVENGIEI